jgi:hypothetical protein
MSGKKSIVRSALRLDAQSAAQLERRSRQIGAFIDDAAIDRILENIDLTGTTGILAAGVDAAKLNAGASATIKRLRWGGQIRSMLSILTAMVRRRKLSTARARKKLTGIVNALSAAKTCLRNDPAYDAALTLAEMLLTRVQDELNDAKSWTNERIAGEFLPAQFLTFTKGRRRQGAAERSQRAVRQLDLCRPSCARWESHTVTKALSAQCRTPRDQGDAANKARLQ